MEFEYNEMFPIGKNTTEYRIVTKDYVSTFKCCDQQMLIVDS